MMGLARSSNIPNLYYSMLWGDMYIIMNEDNRPAASG